MPFCCNVVHKEKIGRRETIVRGKIMIVVVILVVAIITTSGSSDIENEYTCECLRRICHNLAKLFEVMSIVTQF
jgi:hypothetical protein